MAGRGKGRAARAPKTRRSPALKRATAVPHGRDAPAGDLAPPPRLCRLASRARARLARRRRRARAAPARLGADAAVRARRPPRRRRPRRGGAGLDRSRLHGAVLVAVRPHGRARRRPPARHRRGGALAGVVSPASLVTPSARAVAIAAVLATLWGFANARRVARVVRVDVPIAGLPAAARRLRDRPDQRRPRRADHQAAVRRGDRRRRQPARRRPRRRHRRPRRRLGRASWPSTSRPLAEPALARRQLLRHRQPRVLLGRRRLGARAAPTRPDGADERACVVRRGDARWSSPA